ncbi:SpoIIE family protein phosphatase [Kistimonas scapharcae]|uniref:SpoIIE family protein phosphatase n=1 Tax=Kistimonas scapharcae TaxID=1036133 RepID=A0ABP8V1D2_9GAMM
MTAGSSRLLVIDDDAIVRDSIVAYLEDSGFEILQADNGESGLAVFTECKPDLVLCDLRMPRMDGLALLRKVHEISPETPFIVVSGAGVMADVVEALRLGASDYIIKPIVDLEVLEYAIKRALDSADLAAQNRKYRESLEEAIQSLKESLDVLRADQKAGRQVQLKMLPPRPFVFQGYQLDYKIYPSLYLSGDFVDYFPVNDHCFGFYLADVSGHGASSAFVTVLLKNMFLTLLQEYRSKSRMGTVKPSYVLKYLNQGLLATGLGKHVTVFGGVVDTRAHTLTYAFGGHYPFPILASREKTVLIERNGLPVGLFEDASFDDVTIDLPRDFSLTVFSDGILEVLPQKTLKEKEDYLLSVISEGATTAEALMRRLNLDDIHETPDDIALLVLANTTE